MRRWVEVHNHDSCRYQAIIAFARIGRLDLLRQVLGEIIIPQAVYEELAMRGRGRPGSPEVEQSTWIQRRTLADHEAAASLPTYLHSGEREAFGLAEHLGVQLLLDERRGRNIAIGRGIEVFGSLGVIVEAKRQGLIPQARAVVDDMLSVGYWIDEDLVASLLQEVGE